MGYFTDHARARWAVPGTALAVVAGAALVSGRGAEAAGSLPPRSPEQLLVDLQQARLTGLSGTVVQTADLGLPELPGLSGGDGGSSSLESVVTGTHTWRVWYAGPTQSRVALVGHLGESDIIRNGRDLWIWSSREKSAVHRLLPAKSPNHSRPAPSDLPKTPQEAADKALAALDPTTEVTTSGSAVVAGRPSYELVLSPKQSGTVVKEVRISVDAKQHIPLRVQVYSTKRANPAFEVGFTQVEFDKPEARQFEFNPPPGTKVTEAGRHAGPGSGPDAKPERPSDVEEPMVVGTGWGSVVVADLPAEAANELTSGEAARMLRSLPRVSGAWGSGRLLSGTLFSAVLTDDGRVAVGAVAPDRLYAALGAR